MHFLTFICFNLIYFSIATDLPSRILTLYDHKACIEGQLRVLPTGYEIVSPIVIASNNKKEELISNEILELITTETRIDDNPVSEVERIAVHNKIKYNFELTKEEGLPHKKFFEVTLHLGDEKYVGQGSSLKEAKQLASSQAVTNTQFEKPAEKEKNTQNITPTVILNNIAFKLGIKVRYSMDGDGNIFSDYSYYDVYGKEKHKNYMNVLNNSLNYNHDNINIEEDNTQGPFKVIVHFGNKKFTGYGRTKQAAKHAAALAALKQIEGSLRTDDNFCFNQGINCNHDELKSPTSSIYEIGQKYNLGVSFELVEKAGPEHKTEFKMKCILGTFTTEGIGSTKKQAKATAAQNMLIYLKNNKLFKEPASSNLNRKSKKKKTKVARKNFMKNSKETLNALWDSLVNIFDSSFHLDTTQHQADVRSENNYKDQMLSLTSTLGIDTKFTDISKSDKLHFSLLSLETYPPHLCLGKGETIEKARNKASLYGISFLKKSGIDFVVPKNIESSNFEYIDIKKDIADVEEDT